MNQMGLNTLLALYSSIIHVHACFLQLMFLRQLYFSFLPVQMNLSWNVYKVVNDMYIIFSILVCFKTSLTWVTHLVIIQVNLCSSMRPPKKVH